MKNYEYKFVKVTAASGLKNSFEECKKVILAEAMQGWRLKQVVTPIGEKAGLGSAAVYEIIFEKETEA